MNNCTFKSLLIWQLFINKAVHFFGLSAPEPTLICKPTLRMCQYHSNAYATTASGVMWYKSCILTACDTSYRVISDVLLSQELLCSATSAVRHVFLTFPLISPDS